MKRRGDGRLTGILRTKMRSNNAGCMEKMHTEQSKSYSDTSNVFPTICITNCNAGSALTYGEANFILQ